jgi:hypothetical protein
MVLSRHEPACHVSSPMSGCSADPSPNHSVVNNGKKTRRNDSNSTPPPHDKFRTREGRLKRCEFVPCVHSSTLFDFVGVLTHQLLSIQQHIAQASNFNFPWQSNLELQTLNNMLGLIWNSLSWRGFAWMWLLEMEIYLVLDLLNDNQTVNQLTIASDRLKTI